LKFLGSSLSRLGNEKFDPIVTDPPYRDDVAYAELRTSTTCGLRGL